MVVGPGSFQSLNAKASNMNRRTSFLSRVPLAALLLAGLLLAPWACKTVRPTSSSAQGRLAEIQRHLRDAGDGTVLVAAHRGDWRNAPENSLAAIRNCIRMGVDIVEIDVRRTKDSALVLMHDPTIDRTTTGKGKVSQWTLESLKRLRLRNGCGVATRHRIPTLEEAMLAAKGKILVNLDKCSGYMDLAYRVLQKTGTVAQAVFKGKDPLPKVKRRFGDLLGRIIYMPILDPRMPRPTDYVRTFITGYHPLAFEVLFRRDDSPMFDIIREIRDHGIRVWVNTMWESLCGPHDDDRALTDPDASWGWAVDRGAGIIQTDRPGLLLAYLRRKGLHR